MQICAEELWKCGQYQSRLFRSLNWQPAEVAAEWSLTSEEWVFCIWIYYEVDSTWWKQEQFSWSTDTWSTNWTFKPRQFQSNQGSLALLVRTHSYAESIYFCQGGCFTKLCLSVCLLATLHKSSWKFHICRIIVRFWRSSGSGSRKFYYEILPSWNRGNSENFCR